MRASGFWQVKQEPQKPDALEGWEVNRERGILQTLASRGGSGRGQRARGWAGELLREGGIR